MRIIGLIAFLFFLISPLSAIALDVDHDFSKPVSFEEFQYQRALYNFMKGDYLTSSGITGALLYSPVHIRNKIILLAKLSDMKRYYSGHGYPRYIARFLTKDQPELLLLLNAAYKKGAGKIYATIGNEIKNHLLNSYFDGMTLLDQNRIDDAEKKMLQVTRGDLFYPYARIALAQIYIIKQNPDAAESYLKELLTDSSLTENTRDRVNLLTAQISFKKGLYRKALNKFMVIPPESIYTKDALTGRVWCYIELNNIDKAISLIKEINTGPHYDHEAKSIQLTLGHLYIRSGRPKKAARIFEKLDAAISRDNEYLFNTFNDGNYRIRYVSKLLGMESAPIIVHKNNNNEKFKLQPLNKGMSLRKSSGNSDFQIQYRSLLFGKKMKKMAEHENFYLKILKRNTRIISLVNQYKYLSGLETAYKSNEKKFKYLETYIINTKKGLTNRLTKIGAGVRQLKYTLAKTVEKADLNTSVSRDQDEGNLSFFSSLEKNITDQWQSALERDFTEYEKKTIGMILQQGVETLQCPNLPFICPVIDIINSGIKQEKVFISKEDSDLLQEMTYNLDLMGRDMESIGMNDRIIYEKLFSKIKNRVNKKITENMKALRDFENLKVGIKENIAEIDKIKQKIVSMIDRSISDQMLKLRYENETFKILVRDGLSLATSNNKQ